MVAVTMHSGVRCTALLSLRGLDLRCFVHGAGFFDRKFLRRSGSSSSEAPLQALHRLLTVHTCKQSSITIQTFCVFVCAEDIDNVSI